MPPDFFIKQDDLLPELAATLQDANGTAVNLTGATVVFSMTPVGDTTPKINRAAATVVSAAAGTVKYTWTGTDTDTVGDFYAEFEATFAGKKESFPNDGHLIVKVIGDLA